MVLVGWALDISTLKSVLPIWVTMKPNTAVGFILTGIGLLLTTRLPATFNSKRLTLFYELIRHGWLLAGLIGLLTLGEYMFDWNPGLDQWLFMEPAGTVGTTYPGRMAPETALCFVLLDAALWLSGGSRKSRRAMLASMIFGLLVTTLALAAMMSYSMPGYGSYGWFGLTFMAMHSAILFALLGVAVISVILQQDSLQWSLSRNATLAFACGMAVLVFVGFNTHRSQYWLKELGDRIVHSEQAQTDINSILIETIDAYAHSRGYVITGDERFLNSYFSAKADSNKKLDALHQIEFSSAEPGHQEHFNRISAQVNTQFQWLQQVVDARRAGSSDASRNNMIRQGEDLLDKLRSTFARIESEHRQLIEQLKRESESVARLSYITIASGTFASLLIFLVVIFRLDSAVADRQQAKQEVIGSEEKLAESELHFRAVTESAHDAIVTAAPTGNIVGWNAAAERLFGYTEAEIVGQSITMLMPEQFRNPHRQGLARMLADGVPHIIGKTVEVEGLRKDGSEFPLEISLAQWQAAKGQFFTAIIRDITERKQAEQALSESESRFRNIVETTSDWIWEVDENAVYTYASPKIHDILGYEVAEILGKTPFDFMPHAEAKRAADLFGPLVAAKTPITNLENTNLHKDGHAVVMETSGVPIIDSTGKFCGYRGIDRDITERKRMETELRESEAHYKRITDGLTDYQYTVRIENGRAVETTQSTACAKVTGYTAEEFAANPYLWIQMVVPEDRDLVMQNVQQILAGNNVTPIEHRIIRKSGKISWVSDTTILFKDSSGKLLSYDGVIKNITERKLAEAALRQLNEELESKVVARTADLEYARFEAEQANQAKSAFLSAMSHEIRTPMNGVIGMLDVLQQSSLKGAQVEMVNIIHDSAFALLAIIDDILDFSKIEAGKLQIGSESMDVAEVVEGACKTLDRMALKKRVELTLFTDPAIPKAVMGDAGRLRQILVNLVNNAIKFSSGRERQGRVSVRALMVECSPAESVPQQVTLAINVTDNGIGIDQATLMRLFTPFTQADTSTTRTYGGTGLGLAISRQLANLMGGEIAVRSEPDKGSVFGVHLPFALPPTAAGKLTPLAEPLLAGLSCLVVDGPDGIGADLATYLAHDQVLVERAADLAGARQWLVNRPAGLCVVVIDTVANHPLLDDLRAAAGARPDLDVRFVVIGRGGRRRCRVEATDWVRLDAEVMHRRAFLEAVEIAAGRAEEPDWEELYSEAKITHTPLTREEARQRGSLILIAEDNEVNQKVILQQLTLLGEIADIANNGREALERWQSGDYGMLITDLHMPEMDGYELTAAIRAAESAASASRSGRAPIIAYTANATKGEAEHCRAVGMDDYLSKPVQMVNLKAMLKKWLPLAAEAVAVELASTPDGLSDAGRASSRDVGPKPDLQSAGIPVAVDVSVLKALVGEDEAILRDFFHDFRLSAEKIAEELRIACESGRATAASEAAHKLKSSSRAVGALALGDLCAEMEEAGKAGDREALTVLLSIFDQEFANVEGYLEGYLS
jgi:PAS domain S-box-containing protein